jgi:hypothetical protein
MSLRSGACSRISLWGRPSCWLDALGLVAVAFGIALVQSAPSARVSTDARAMVVRAPVSDRTSTQERAQ